MVTQTNEWTKTWLLRSGPFSCLLCHREDGLTGLIKTSLVALVVWLLPAALSETTFYFSWGEWGAVKAEKKALHFYHYHQFYSLAKYYPIFHAWMTWAFYNTLCYFVCRSAWVDAWWRWAGWEFLCEILVVWRGGMLRNTVKVNKERHKSIWSNIESSLLGWPTNKTAEAQFFSKAVLK